MFVAAIPVSDSVRFSPCHMYNPSYESCAVLSHCDRNNESLKVRVKVHVPDGDIGTVAYSDFDV